MRNCKRLSVWLQTWLRALYPAWANTNVLSSNLTERNWVGSPKTGALSPGAGRTASLVTVLCWLT